MKPLMTALVMLALCNTAHAACTDDRRAELEDVVIKMESVTSQMESYVVDSENMHVENDDPETIFPILEQFMTTLKSEFNNNKDVYNSLDMQYDCPDYEDRVHAVYERVTNASISYAELKFQLRKLSQDNR